MKGKKIISFVVIIVLLWGLFIFSVNSGSLKVSYGQLFQRAFCGL